MLQASPEYRLDEQALDNMFVRNGTEMAPISQFVTLKRIMGSEVENRFNLFSAITVNVNPAPGYSTGEVQQVIKEVANQSLPAGYGYEYGGISREEAASGGTQTIFIYAICILLIFLILACLYESFLIPFAVIFSVPFGLMGSFLFAKLFGLENNIYLQTGVIMLTAYWQNRHFDYGICHRTPSEGHGYYRISLLRRPSTSASYLDDRIDDDLRYASVDVCEWSRRQR